MLAVTRKLLPDSWQACLFPLIQWCGTSKDFNYTCSRWQDQSVISGMIGIEALVIFIIPPVLGKKNFILFEENSFIMKICFIFVTNWSSDEIQNCFAQLTYGCWKFHYSKWTTLPMWKVEFKIPQIQKLWTNKHKYYKKRMVQCKVTYMFMVNKALAFGFISDGMCWSVI